MSLTVRASSLSKIRISDFAQKKKKKRKTGKRGHLKYLEITFRGRNEISRIFTQLREGYFC